MDSRCPRKLGDYPIKACTKGLVRLKAMRLNPNISHNDEESLGDCPWYVNNKGANYCFWKYLDDINKRPLDTIEISRALNITQAAVYSALSRSSEKIRESFLKDAAGD